jgi:glycosyltransferase involved in cell wall biosynthesis
VSLIVPTKNEAGNIEELIKRVQGAVNGLPMEIIFVDDSTDETPSVIARAASKARLPISLIHRENGHRGNGLGGAVQEGVAAAKGEWFCVMDGDLQHPPELIPGLLESARQAGTDLAIASRYASSERVLGLEKGRSFISKLCIAAARVFFPMRLRNITDPLSGFFLARRDAIDEAHLRPRGFKILLEILVRFPHLRVSEIPFVFHERYSGQSKAVIREGLRFLMLLLTLRVKGVAPRALRFVLVGASGLIVNQALLVAFTDMGGLHYLLSAGLATQGSSLWNFTLTEGWVYHDRLESQGRFQRLGQFLIMNNGSLLLRVPFLALLTSGLGVHYVASNVITLLALALGRYLFSDQLIWGGSLKRARNTRLSPASGVRLAGAPSARAVRKGYAYDIHGIVRIGSEVRLPELDYFRTFKQSAVPDLLVRIATSSSKRFENGDSFRYREALGPFGFWVNIARGEPTEVEAGRLLKASPHVLYTNVVEPVLRWMFVHKGYALVHAACMVSDQGAVFITAKTDTGKTTTILRTLTNEGRDCQFLSDDMTVVSRDGVVLSYPKPLTISRHTLEAVSGSPLGILERLALQVQSRVHSKSGRQTALAMTRTLLPMATVNSIAQMIVPPPKYSIDKLVPGVTIGRSAKPSRLLVIERGSEEAETPLNQQDAMQILFANSEDAYGFPPYAKLAPYLYEWDGVDLRVVEREIITEALNGCPATLLSSQQRNWWQRLPALLNWGEQGDTGSEPVVII